MKRTILWIALTGFLSISCDKENPEPKNKIVYTGFPASSERTTVREYYSTLNPFCGQLPLPNDSIAFFNVDLNNDSQTDFIIELKHYEQITEQYCGHCPVIHIKTIQIKPVTTNCFISVDTVQNYWIRNYAETEAISISDVWNNASVTTLLEGGCMIPNISFDDTYWGLKVNDMIAWIHVKRTGKNGLIPKEYALNLIENNPIRAGEKE